VRLVAIVVAIATLVAACSSSSGDGDKPARTTAPAEGSGDAFVRHVVGEAEVTMGDRTWSIELTSCEREDGRLTAQGDDGEGTTIVGTFRSKPRSGSVTLMSGERSWSIGGAGTTEIDDLEVATRSASGSGTFTFRSLAPPDEGDAAPQEEPRSGSFAISCADG